MSDDLKKQREKWVERGITTGETDEAVALIDRCEAAEAQLATARSLMTEQLVIEIVEPLTGALAAKVAAKCRALAPLPPTLRAVPVETVRQAAEALREFADDGCTHVSVPEVCRVCFARTTLAALKAALP